MAKLSNATLWNEIRKAFPQFASHTSEVTSKFFTKAGFEKLKNWNVETLNDFFNLSIRVYLQLVNISHAKDRFEEQDFGEYYENPMGGYIQRMATTSIKPVSPAYKNLKNGNSIDPWVVRKPEVEERFFKQNFDYQSLITIPDEFQFKQIFISEFGMSEFLAGIMEGLRNGYTIQKYLNKKEAINAGLNSTNNPLQDSQKVVAALSAEPTNDELTNFVLAVQNVISAMDLAPQSNAFNALHFSTTQDKSRLRLLVRPGFKNALKVKVLPYAYNRDELNLDIPVIEVSDFGGLIPYKEAEFTTQLYPVYDKLGTEIGFAETENAEAITVETHDVFWKDPNENVNAVLADKGWIFESVQNPYTVEPIRNPRGLYTNYWASSPNNTICVDALYNVVEFVNA